MGCRRILWGAVLLFGCGARALHGGSDGTAVIGGTGSGVGQGGAGGGVGPAGSSGAGGGAGPAGSGGAGGGVVDGQIVTNVAVDDEIGSVCATKANGSYRCWDADGAVAPQLLPDASYARVELAARGLVGLTRSGRLHAVDTPVPDDLPPIATFRATNLWGGQGICGRSTGGNFHFGTYDPINHPDSPTTWRVVEGPFIDATCAYEGYYAVLTPEGTPWERPRLPALPSGDAWSRLAIQHGPFFVG